jgi:hypothetical protein
MYQPVPGFSQLLTIRVGCTIPMVLVMRRRISTYPCIDVIRYYFKKKNEKNLTLQKLSTQKIIIPFS